VGDDEALLAFLVTRLAEDEAAAGEIHNGQDCSSCSPLQLSCDCGVPARVRREVAAKRAILAEHKPVPRDPPWAVKYECLSCFAAYPCKTALLIAAVYAGHPDCRQEWEAMAPSAVEPG